MLNRQIGDLKALIFKSPARIQNTFMIDLGRNNVSFLIAVKLSNPFDTHIIAFSSPTRKDYLLALCTNDFTDMVSRRFTRLFGVPAVLVRL